MTADWLSISAEPIGEDEVGVRRVPGSRTRVDLFDEWARALDFPAYFGHNWDALADVLTDLPDSLSIVVDNADTLLTAEPPSQLAILLRILARAGLRVTFHATDVALLRTRVTAALDPNLSD